MFDKKSLSERDICTKFITPAIETAGWDIQTTPGTWLTLSCTDRLIEKASPQNRQPQGCPRQSDELVDSYSSWNRLRAR